MLVKANKDPKIQIKETDQDSYHVEFKRITGTLFNPETSYDIQIYSRKDFALLKKAIADQGIYITSYQDMRVVHDPTFTPEPEPESEHPKPGPKPASTTKKAQK